MRGTLPLPLICTITLTLFGFQNCGSFDSGLTEKSQRPSDSTIPNNSSEADILRNQGMAELQSLNTSSHSSFSSDEDISIQVTGEVELVLDWEESHDRLSPTYSGTNGVANTFDSPVRFFKDWQGQVFTMAATAVNYRIPLNSDFKPIRAMAPSDIIFDSSKTLTSGNALYHRGYGENRMSGSCIEGDYDNQMWVFGVWTEDGHSYSALAHHEFYPKTCPIATTSAWVNSIHHMTSSDGGQTFKPKDYKPFSETGRSNANRAILIPKPSSPQLPHKYTYGFYHPSNIVKEGNYYYASATAILLTGKQASSGEALADGGLVLIRTQNVSSTQGWQIYTQSGWLNLDKNSHLGMGGSIEPYIFLKQSSYNPYTQYPNGGQLLSNSLVFHSQSGKWLALGYSNQGATTVSYSVTNSLAEPEFSKIYSVKGAPVLEATNYPSITSHTSPGYVFQQVDNEPYLYFVASNNSTPVPGHLRTSISDLHSRSLWRVKLRIKSSENISKFTEGHFKIGNGIYYSNGSSFCHFTSTEQFYSLSGLNSTDSLPNFSSRPLHLANDGACMDQQPSEVKIVEETLPTPPGDLVSYDVHSLQTIRDGGGSEIPIPSGLFRIGEKIYYSNGSEYCYFPDMLTYHRLTGRNNTEGLVDYPRLPTRAMSDGSFCEIPIPSGLFRIGEKIYYSNGSEYCHFPDMLTYHRLTGRNNTEGLVDYPRLPTRAMSDGGNCQ